MYGVRGVRQGWVTVATVTTALVNILAFVWGEVHGRNETFSTSQYYFYSL